MSAHNLLAFQASQWMLSGLRVGSTAWTVPDITSAVTLSSSFESWPRPDAVLYDASARRSLAVEFKPPGHGKREYVTGLGQCMTYLNSYDYAVLVTPVSSRDGFGIADYLASTVNAAPLASAPLGILAFDLGPSTDMRVVVPVRRRTTPITHVPSVRLKFWGYWRDLSNHDVLRILRLVDDHRNFEKAWREFWAKDLSVGKARMWNGRNRKSYAASSKASHELNSSLALRHADLVTEDGGLTEHGLELLQLGKVYGAESAAFVDELARRVLLDARHLELIYWIYELQPRLAPSAFTSSVSFVKALESQLVAEGVIRPPTGHAKPAYIRDEPKLWNHLGILRRHHANQYFWPNQGYVFDWRRITGLLAG